MKKTYMMPDTHVYELKIESLMDSASVNNINTETTAAEGTEGSGVNFSRGGGFFGDED